MRVITYNMRFDTEIDGVNSFKNRVPLIKSVLHQYKADIIAFQEILPHMKKWISDTFKKYSICGVGRNADLSGESNIIAYRRDKFELVSTDTFWLSDTPHVSGSRFNTDQSYCPRICTSVTLREIKSGKLFRHYNTHLDHIGKQARAQGISLILSRIAKDYNTWHLPIILTGDLNVTPDSDVIKSISHFSGCGESLKDVTSDLGSTFHSYRPDNPGSKIDYIFTNLPCDTSKSFLLKENVEGVFLSDHYPVCATIKL